MAKCIVRVHHPDLTPEERVKREEEIKQAMVRLVIAGEEAKRRKAAEAGAVEG